MRLRHAAVCRTELVPVGNGALLPIQKEVALDRAVWWPLIERERWNHRVVMALLETLDAALFGDMPTIEPPDYPEDDE